MAKMNKSIMFFLAVGMGVVIQLLLIYGETMDAPHKAVIEFSKAYFKLDQSMESRLCSELVKEDNNALVKNYLDAIQETATERGFETSFLKQSLSSIHTETHAESETSAKVHLTATRKVSINGPFTWVATIFQLGKTYDVDETFHVIKEDGCWKICETSLAFMNRS